MTPGPQPLAGEQAPRVQVRDPNMNPCFSRSRAFIASLALELEAFNVRVKLVEPGYGPSTRFTSNTGPRLEGLTPEAYAPFAQRIFASFTQPAAVTTESDVAEVVWGGANHTTGQLRFPARADAVALAQSR
jgi:NAD(P)-dependent dehydrogenase (short-subunit alcohol dehydrogenase family)